MSAVAGIGLRSQHFPDVLETPPDVGWLEIHSENFIAIGGPRLRALEQVRRDYPISCHSVGLSLGSAEGVDPLHVERLGRLYDGIEPVLISDHLSWSVCDGTYLNDLLPLPYTPEALDIVSRNISYVQDKLRRQLLIENPSTYLKFEFSSVPEWEFIDELVARTGCGVLLDVNNVFVSATNLGFSPTEYIRGIDGSTVCEIHLAGHTQRQIEGAQVLIDDHGSPVSSQVWRLFEQTLSLIGAKPTLIEWDTDIPPLDVLMREAEKAEGLLFDSRPHKGQAPGCAPVVAVT